MEARDPDIYNLGWRLRAVQQDLWTLRTIAERNRHRWPRMEEELHQASLTILRHMADLGDSVTTHSLRHACATEMLRGGANVRHVQEMLGHAHLSTTQVYTHVVPHDLKKVHIETAQSERRRVIDVPKFQNKGWKDFKNGGYYRD